MDILEKIRDRARLRPVKIVLPESGDQRTIEAAGMIASARTAVPVLVGNEKEIRARGEGTGIPLSGIEVFDPDDGKFLKDATRLYLERARAKGVGEQEARETVRRPLYAACMMVALGIADGVVSGATHTTAESVRAYLRSFGPKTGVKTVSSFFLMVLPGSVYGRDGVLMYSDCGVVANPSAVQLAEIAASSKESFESLVGGDPRVALLSFSTKGSADDPMLEKIREALEILKQRCPGMHVDGELQFDAALVPAIGAKKAPGSNVAGRANVLIFPDLNSGNIAYKITERLAGAVALGPVLQGLSRAANDLSRGCSASDIADVAAITAVQAQGIERSRKVGQ